MWRLVEQVLASTRKRTNSMKQEEMKKVMEAFGKGGVTVAGDLVMEKHVEYEVGNVENGGIGIQINGVEMAEPVATSKPADSQGQKDEVLSLLVHPAVDEKQEWLVHDEIKRLVGRQGLQEICQYLLQLKAERKVLLPQNAEKAYNELVRLGMPSGEGYSLKTFMKYYKR